MMSRSANGLDLLSATKHLCFPVRREQELVSKFYSVSEDWWPSPSSLPAFASYTCWFPLGVISASFLREGKFSYYSHKKIKVLISRTLK